MNPNLLVVEQLLREGKVKAEPRSNQTETLVRPWVKIFNNGIALSVEWTGATNWWDTIAVFKNEEEAADPGKYMTLVNSFYAPTESSVAPTPTAVPADKGRVGALVRWDSLNRIWVTVAKTEPF